MRAATVTWAAGYNAGDVDKIAALYAEDAIAMPPGAPAAKGRAAIRAYLAADTAAAKAGGVKLSLADDGMGVSGSLGWHSGTVTVTNAAGATLETGKWLETWRKADGKWLMIRDIWNTDAPPAPAAPSAPAAPGATREVKSGRVAGA